MGLFACVQIGGHGSMLTVSVVCMFAGDCRVARPYIQLANTARSQAQRGASRGVHGASRGDSTVHMSTLVYL